MSTDSMNTSLPVLTAKDFASDQEIRWCPRCGDYSILAQMKKVLPTLGIPREKFVFVSGIGCSSRFPDYMNTYGFHSIHGRAPAIATGLAAPRPDPSVRVLSGHADSPSIGGHHPLPPRPRHTHLQLLKLYHPHTGATPGPP